VAPARHPWPLLQQGEQLSFLKLLVLCWRLATGVRQRGAVPNCASCRQLLPLGRQRRDHAASSLLVSYRPLAD